MKLSSNKYKFRAEILRVIAFALSIPFCNYVLDLFSFHFDDLLLKSLTSLPISIFLLVLAYRLLEYAVNSYK